ncbi:MAG TPA: glycosyltransferase family A protein, partial [Tepidisphaeraceae bacterium]|nr:glycosyltransferase family A protein [Tepidisphaeraceae bacterium]
MTSDPLVSIIIPARNRSALLPETLASISRQTVPYWQAIVVDDGSSDATDATMARLCHDEPRFSFLTRQSARAGADACRNQGLSACTGEFVVFLDSDDLLAPACLEHRLRVLQSDKNLDFAVSYAEYFQFHPGDMRRLHNVATDEDPIDRFLHLDYPWQTAGPMWRRRALARLGPWDENLPSWQDWEFHLRALIGGVKYRWLPEIDYFIRIAPADGSATSQRQVRQPEHLAAAPQLFSHIGKMLADKQMLWRRRRTALAALHLRTAEQWKSIGQAKRGMGVLATARREGVIG